MPELDYPTDKDVMQLVYTNATVRHAFDIYRRDSLTWNQFLTIALVALALEVKQIRAAYSDLIARTPDPKMTLR